MKYKCESCDCTFVLGINGGTVVFEDDTESSLCSYCNSILETTETKPNFDDTSLIR